MKLLSGCMSHSYLAIGTFMETVDPACQSALCSHQSGCLPPQILETKWKDWFWGLKRTTHIAFNILTHRWERLHHITVIDKARVRQKWGAAEARQGSPLRPQQHQVTRRHLWEIGQASSNTCKTQFDGKPKIKGQNLFIHVIVKMLHFSPIILAAVDAPTIMERFGAMKDILDSTYSYILCLDWFNSRAMSQASSSCFSSSSVNIDLKVIDLHADKQKACKTQ